MNSQPFHRKILDNSGIKETDNLKPVRHRDLKHHYGFLSNHGVLTKIQLIMDPPVPMNHLNGHFTIPKCRIGFDKLNVWPNSHTDSLFCGGRSLIMQRAK